jgi:endonuclease-3
MKTQAKTTVLQKLENTYFGAKPQLNYSSEYELLVAVILSAQCTDKRVNEVTKVLFQKYNTPYKMSQISQEELEKYIYSCGFFRNKAKNIISVSNILLQKYNGQVPNDFNALTSLPGIGRKTANVVMSVAFNVPAIAVDTQVFRVSNRIGLAKAKTPFETEMQLNKLIEKNSWSKTHHYLIYLGRDVCKAGKPNCQNCVIKELCEKNEKPIY